MVLKGRIKTTEPKAKSIKGQVEKMVSRAKTGAITAKRQLLATIGRDGWEKLVSEITPHFLDRSSGFTQIIKIGPRKGDNAPMVFLQWVGFEEMVKTHKEEKKKKEASATEEKVPAKTESKESKSLPKKRVAKTKKQKAQTKKTK